MTAADIDALDVAAGTGADTLLVAADLAEDLGLDDRATELRWRAVLLRGGRSGWRSRTAT